MATSLASLIVFALLLDIDLTLDEIVAANESAVASIHSVDAHLEMRKRATDQLIETIRWSRSGSKERVRSDYVTDQSAATRYSDCFADGSNVHFLGGMDPNHPAEIPRPFQAKGIRGFKQPQTRNLINMKPTYLLLLHPGLTANDEKRTLSELVRSSRAAFGGAGAHLVGQRTVQGHNTFHIRLKHPGVAEESTGTVQHRGAIMDVFVDPSVNFHVRRVESHFDAGGAADASVFAMEVTRFQDYGNGVYLPQEAIGESRDANGQRNPLVENRTIVTDAQVNEPLSEEALAFRFPENLLVTVLPAVNGRSPVNVIGEDGDVVRTIRTDEEMQALLRSVGMEDTRAAEERQWMYFLCGLIGVFVVVAFVLFRKWKRNRA